MRDESAERVSQNRQKHVLVEPEAPIEPQAFVQVAKEAAVESVSSLGTDSNQGHDMVTRKTMTIARFVTSTRLTPQQQESQGRDPTPPSSFKLFPEETMYCRADPR